MTKIGLFGSCVRDDFKEESDIDIAIEMLNEKKRLFTSKRDELLFLQDILVLTAK